MFFLVLTQPNKMKMKDENGVRQYNKKRKTIFFLSKSY